jgi:hypothetical protein
MPRLDDQTMLKKEPYRSILNLLRECSYLNGRRVGLEHAHFLYMLKAKKLKMSVEKEEEMKQFFSQFHFTSSDGIGFFPEYGGIHRILGKPTKRSGTVKQGCIRRPQRLNDALTMLIKKKWVETEGKPRYRKYYLSRKYYTDLEKRTITYLLNIWNQNMVITSESMYTIFLNKPAGFNPLKQGDMAHPLHTTSDFVLCGLPWEMMKKLSDEEKKNLTDWLLTIETHLWKIIELKYTKMKIPAKKFIEKERQKETSLQDMIQADHIGFYYTACKSMIEE